MRYNVAQFDTPEDARAAGVPDEYLGLYAHPNVWPPDDTRLLSQGGGYQGLQVQMPDGGWLPVPIIPGVLQVFSGTLLTRWTGGRLRPGRHRVVAGGTVTRRSTAVFCYPSLDTVVRPLGAFTGPEGSDDEGILVWDHVRQRAEDYLEEFGRPEQVAAWQESRPYVAPLAETSAGR